MKSEPKMPVDTPEEDSLIAAGREMRAVVESTAAAANAIMECAEAVMQAPNAGAESYRHVVEEQMLRIFESCSFQDLTGQRLAKVIEGLGQLESKLRTAEALLAAKVGQPEDDGTRDERSRRLLLNGPQPDSSRNTQAEVDRLFAASRRAT